LFGVKIIGLILHNTKLLIGVEVSVENMNVLDLQGFACPMPVIKLKKWLSLNDLSEKPLYLKVSDKGALKDIPAFCQQKNIACQVLRVEDVLEFRLEAKNV
jgi:tRNA 2-thiouridine synthesizing protein A